MRRRPHENPGTLRLVWTAVFAGSLLLLPGCNDRPDSGDVLKQPKDTSTAAMQTQSLSCVGCNIILLNIELLRADHIGLLTSEQDLTRNIDSFFADSVVFERVSAPAGESYRSNLSVQTAMQAFHYTVDQKRIDDFARRGSSNPSIPKYQPIASILTRYPTIAEILHRHDYHTVNLNQGIRAGKWLLLNRGFRESINWGRRKTSFRETISALDETLGRGIDKLFLLYRPEVLHPFPYYYPDDRQRIDLPNRIFYGHRPQFRRYNVRFNLALADPEKREVHRSIYHQQLKYVDDELGGIFRKIIQEKLHLNSVIVLYSNHGSGLGDNGVHRLAVSYQSCVHVPLLIRLPSLHEQVRVNTPVSLIDLVPTLLEIVGIDPPSGFDGSSLLRYLSGPNGTPGEAIIGRNDYDEYIRVGDWKLIIKNGEHRELYNLVSDPHETRSVLTGHAAVARELETKLMATKLEILERQPD